MIHTRACPRCQKLLGEAVVGLHIHESHLARGTSLNVNGYLTEQLRKQLAPDAAESLSAAQAAWDVYCKHLIEHGLLTPARKAVAFETD
jgi:hypothetical protein